MAFKEKRDPRGTGSGTGRLPGPRLHLASAAQQSPAADTDPAKQDPNQPPSPGDERYDELEPFLVRAAEGDEDAFRSLVEATQGRVFGLVRRMLRCDADTAWDLSQEVYLRVFRGLPGFDRRALFSTWLHKITMNVVITEIRHRRAMKRDRTTLSLQAPIKGNDEFQIDPPSKERAPEDRAEHTEFAQAVRTAVDELPDEFRECVLLRDMQGLSYEEIAEVLDLAPGTVRSKIHRGRCILQRKLRDYR